MCLMIFRVELLWMFIKLGHTIQSFVCQNNLVILHTHRALVILIEKEHYRLFGTR